MSENTKYPVRMGECNNCGWCCQFNGVHRNVVEIETADLSFFKLRGGVETPNGNILYLAHEFLPCSAHNKECNKCKIYENRPQTCQEFPQIPEQIEGTPCSYWFEKDGEKRGGAGSPFPTPPRFFENNINKSMLGKLHT